WERRDSRELAFVVGDKRAPERQRVSGNKQIVCPEGLADLFKARPQRAVNDIRRWFEWKHLDGAKYAFKLLLQPRRRTARCRTTQLGRHDDAGAHLRFANLRNPPGNAAARMAHQIRHDVRVEEEPHRPLPTLPRFPPPLPPAFAEEDQEGEP